MDDRGDGASGTDPREPDELELAELRRRKKDEVERELRHRAAGVPEEDEDEEPPAGTGVWRPPAEMSEPARWTAPLRRLAAFVIVVVAAFLLLRGLADRLFVPTLVPGAVVVPDDTLPVDAPAAFGIEVQNRSGREGEAFAVLVDREGRETAGPAVTVPARGSVVAPVEARLSPGDHVVSLLLLDAWREGEELGAVHGIPVRVGEPEVRISNVRVEPTGRPGEAVEVLLTAVNQSARAEVLTPVVVFVAPDGRETEREGPDLALAPHDSASVRMAVSPPEDGPAGYGVSVILFTARGDRAGEGVHGLPFRLLPDR